MTSLKVGDHYITCLLWSHGWFVCLLLCILPISVLSSISTHVPVGYELDMEQNKRTVYFKSFRPVTQVYLLNWMLKWVCIPSLSQKISQPCKIIAGLFGLWLLFLALVFRALILFTGIVYNCNPLHTSTFRMQKIDQINSLKDSHEMIVDLQIYCSLSFCLYSLKQKLLEFSVTLHWHHIYFLFACQCPVPNASKIGKFLPSWPSPMKVTSDLKHTNLLLKISLNFNIF